MTHFRAEVLICAWIFPLEWIKSVFFSPPPFMLRCSRLLQCLFTSEQLKGPLSPIWDARFLLFYEQKLAWQSQAFQSEPVSSCLVSSPLSVLICLRFPREYIGQPGWVGFPWFCHNWRKLCMFPQPPLCPNHGKLAFTFLITGMGCVWVRSPRQTTKNDLNQGNLRNI